MRFLRTRIGGCQGRTISEAFWELRHQNSTKCGIMAFGAALGGRAIVLPTFGVQVPAAH